MQKPDGSIPKVAMIFSTRLKGVRTICRGVLAYARTHGPWRCQLLEGRDGEQGIALKDLAIDGVIAHNLSHDEYDRISAIRVPVVLCEPGATDTLPWRNVPYVKMDSYGVGVLAGNYYLERGYKSFAYVDETLGRHWSAERRQGFEDTLKNAGFGCTVYSKFNGRERRSWNAECPRMIKFLQGLPKPTAIFAAMDGRARLVLDACAEAKIRVPEEIAVLGVDNDPILCESTVPALSSIRTGGFRRGQKAAELLDALIHGWPIQHKNVVMEPLSIVTRESTGYDAMRDPALSRALRFIRSEAPQRRIDVGDVVRVAGCSRRYVEQHFRTQLNASVRDVILRTRLARVRTLLESSNLSIGEIIGQCGFANESHLSVLFKKSTGLSMRDYRKQNRELPDD